MKKQLTITIDQPCHEKWSNFEITPEGGFCSQCQKTVIDFTSMSDSEIKAYFANSNNNVCGKFKASQLTSYPLPNHTFSIPYFKTFALGVVSLASFLFVPSARALANINERNAKADKEFSPSFYYPADSLGKTSYTIKGVLKDENGEVIPEASVIIKGSAQGTSTDINGEFSLTYDFQIGDVLVFNFIGFETQEYEVKDLSDQVIEIEMVMEYYELMGDVAVVGGAYTEPSFFSKCWNKVKNIFR